MLKYLVRGLVVGAVCAGMLACSGGSGDDDDDDAAQPDSASVMKCNDLVAAYCPAIVDCAVGGGLIPTADRDQSVSECDTGAKKALDCSRAATVADTYDDCMAWLATPDCTYVVDALNSNGATSPLPAICNGVIGLL